MVPEQILLAAAVSLAAISASEVELRRNLMRSRARPQAVRHHHAKHFGQQQAGGEQQMGRVVTTSASKSSIRRFVITEKAPTRAFSWLKAATTAFTFKTLLRHYAKRALTPRSLNVKLGPRHKGHKGRAVWLA